MLSQNYCPSQDANASSTPEGSWSLCPVNLPRKKQPLLWPLSPSVSSACCHPAPPGKSEGRRRTGTEWFLMTDDQTRVVTERMENTWDSKPLPLPMLLSCPQCLPFCIWLIPTFPLLEKLWFKFHPLWEALPSLPRAWLKPALQS